MRSEEYMPIRYNTDEKLTSRLHAFFTRNMTMILASTNNFPAVFLLLDHNGTVLDMYGTGEARITLEEEGIVPGAAWSLKEPGSDAITVGLTEHRKASSVGKGNLHSALQKYALYFAPLTLWKARPPSVTLDFGGVAVIVPVEQHSDKFPLILAAITHDIIMTMHFNQTAFMLYERSGCGILSVDTCMKKDSVTITYCSDRIFEFFGIQPDDVDFKPLDTIIDPLPENKKFWSIIKDQELVNDYPIALKNKGKEVICIISTEIFRQPGINASGVIFYISTPQQISASVSKKICNNAVLTFKNIIGQSPCIKSAIQKAKLLAQADSNVLLLGESGVGKDIFAQAIHNTSSRRNKPFIALNCGALPRDLIASELFGYEGGAFTGARRQGNIGKFELANGGTIFLDEIAELPLELQATMLRVVEQKQLMRVGGDKLINVDVKIISATNADMLSMIARKMFREDLYYRLNTMRLNIPTLRERGEDIVLLATCFIHAISNRIGRSKMILSPEAKNVLLSLPFHGNIRELQNLMECIVHLYPDQQVIEPSHILDNIQQSVADFKNRKEEAYRPAPTRKRYLITGQDIYEALEKCGGNRSHAAKYLGIARKTLYRHMERLGIQ